MNNFFINPICYEGGWHSPPSFEGRTTPESLLLRVDHKCSIGLKALYRAAYVETDSKSKLIFLNMWKNNILLRTEFGVKSGPPSDKSINDDVPCNSIWGFRICNRFVTSVASCWMKTLCTHKKHEMDLNEGFSNALFLNYHRWNVFWWNLVLKNNVVNPRLYIAGN